MKATLLLLALGSPCYQTREMASCEIWDRLSKGELSLIQDLQKGQFDQDPEIARRCLLLRRRFEGKRLNILFQKIRHECDGVFPWLDNAPLTGYQKSYWYFCAGGYGLKETGWKRNRNATSLYIHSLLHSGLPYEKIQRILGGMKESERLWFSRYDFLGTSYESNQKYFETNNLLVPSWILN